MTTTAEHEERARLETVKTALRHALWKLDARLDHYDAEIKQQKEHMWDARRDMDHIEKIAARQSIEQSGTSADVAMDERRRLQKLLHSPYFGRVDFLRAGEAQVLPVYVGVHSFTDVECKQQSPMRAPNVPATAGKATSPFFPFRRQSRNRHNPP